MQHRSLERPHPQLRDESEFRATLQVQFEWRCLAMRLAVEPNPV